MLKYIIFTFLCVSTISHADFETDAIETLARTFHSLDENGGDEVWPQFQMSDPPTVVHFANGHVYGFGLKGELPSWEKKVIHQIPIWYRATPPTPLAPLVASFPIENQQAFIFGLDHGKDYSLLPLFTLIHERFHLHQLNNFHKMRTGRTVPNDYENLNQLAFIELENRLLSRYLALSASDDKIACLKDFSAVNQIRRQTMHPDSVRWEDHQQSMEGLADYVSLKTFQVFPLIHSLNVEQVLVDMRNKKTAGTAALIEDGVKGRHYFVGAVLAMALDHCGIKEWKMRVQKDGASLQQLLDNALDLKANEKKDRLIHAKLQSGWNEIQQIIAKQMEKENSDRERMIADFALQEGIAIHMGLPSGHMSRGGRMEKSCPIDHQRKALIKDNSTTASQDQSWKLDFRGMPLVIEDQKGERLFKMSPETHLHVDGQKILLKDVMVKYFGIDRSFSSIAFQDPTCELSSTRPGKMMVRENILQISFE